MENQWHRCRGSHSGQAASTSARARSRHSKMLCQHEPTKCFSRVGLPTTYLPFSLPHSGCAQISVSECPNSLAFTTPCEEKNQAQARSRLPLPWPVRALIVHNMVRRAQWVAATASGLTCKIWGRRLSDYSVSLNEKGGKIYAQLARISQNTQKDAHTRAERLCQIFLEQCSPLPPHGLIWRQSWLDLGVVLFVSFGTSWPSPVMPSQLRGLCESHAWNTRCRIASPVIELLHLGSCVVRAGVCRRHEVFRRIGRRTLSVASALVGVTLFLVSSCTRLTVTSGLRHQCCLLSVITRPRAWVS